MSLHMKGPTENPTRWVKSQRTGAFDRVERDGMYSGIRRGICDGQSNLQIALALGISDRTVARYRTRHQLPDFYGRR